MTTVLTVAGAYSSLGWLVGQTDVMAPFYRHECTTVGLPLPTNVAPGSWGNVTAVTKVKYNNLSLLFGAVDAKKKIDKAIKDLPADEKVVVMSHSQGSYGAWLWLRDYAAKSTFDPNRLRFLIAGANKDMMLASHVINSKYPIVDVVLQWEKYGDPATVTGSQFFNLAQYNSDKLNLHTKGYPLISLHASPALQKTNGSCTYLYYTTSAKPVVSATKVQLETAYDRSYLT